MTSNQLLFKNLHNSLFKPNVIDYVSRDYATTLVHLGVSQQDAESLTVQIISYVVGSVSIVQVEKNVKDLFISSVFNGRTVFEMIQDGLEDRFEVIFNQIAPYIEGVKGKVFDYGCGSGRLTQMIHDRLGLDTEGVDVRDFRAKGVSVNTVIFDGIRIPAANRKYGLVIATNVLHHIPQNQRAIREINRVCSGRFVGIETIPEGENEKSVTSGAENLLSGEWDRMFWNDVFWNRFLNYADIPVPGTYDLLVNWNKRFGKYFPKEVIKPIYLGIDQKTIQDAHGLIVREK